MAGLTAPTARRRRLGLELRRLREAAGVKLDQAAAHVDVDPSTLSRIENGKGPCRTSYLTALLDMYGITDPQQIQSLKDMAREGQRKGWWDGYDDVPASLGIYVGLESVAVSLRFYEAQLVPGLLQTRDYANAVFRACDPKASTEHIDSQTELRMKRQEVLTRPGNPLELWAILDEAVLRRLVGGRKVMRAQLGKLLEAAELPSVTLQVLPFTQGAHAGLNGPFCIMDFPGGEPGTVYVGSAAGNTFLDKPNHIRRWAAAFDQLRADAMSPSDSREMIATLSTET
jgi:DNA-binding XRE family transcriptional regulator